MEILKKVIIIEDEPTTICHNLLEEANEMESTTPEEIKPIWEIDPDALNPYTELPEITTWVKIGDRPAIPKEGIITFAAKQKQGKSLATYALTIPLLTGTDFNTVKPLGTPNYIMCFDMEMSETSLLKRLKKHVETIRENVNKFVIFPLKKRKMEERLEIIKEKVNTYNPEIIIIDQVAKMLPNINDPVLSSQIIDEIDKISIGRSVWLVIHENKNDEHLRGHVGSNLQNAHVELYHVKKESHLFTITCQEARDTDPEDSSIICFTYSEEMGICDGANESKEKEQREVNELKGLFENIFQGNKELRRDYIQKEIMSKKGVKESMAKNIFSKAEKKNIITKKEPSHLSPYILKNASHN